MPSMITDLRSTCPFTVITNCHLTHTIIYMVYQMKYYVNHYTHTYRW